MSNGERIVWINFFKTLYEQNLICMNSLTRFFKKSTEGIYGKSPKFFMPSSYLAATQPPTSFDIETTAPLSSLLVFRLSVKQVRTYCSIKQEVGDGVKSESELGIFPLFLFMF
jgi:hypothetical protein